MKKGNATVISVIALALVVALGVTYFGATPAGDGSKGDKGDSGLTGPQGPKGDAGIDGKNGRDGKDGSVDSVLLKNLQNVLKSLSDTITSLPKSNLGATPGYDFNVPYFGINRLKTYYRFSNLLQGTSTPCSIQSPTASSTLVRAGAFFDTGTTTVLELEWARSTTAFATTTRIGALQRITGNTAGVSYATTSVNTFPLDVFFTNNWLVLKVSAPEASTNIHTNGTGFVPTGTCFGIFQAIDRR